MSAQDDTTQDPQAPADTSTNEPVQAGSFASGADEAGSQEQQAAEQAAQAERDEKGRFKGVQPRIDELTRKRHEAEREAAYWRGVATQGKAQPSAGDKPAAPDKPTPDKFADYAEFVEALADWKADQRIAQALEKREAESAQKRQAETRIQSWEQRQAATRAAVPDYDAVVGASDAPVATHVAEALQESEHGPALAYHLAKNPAELERLNGLSPREADRAIGRLEERLTANAAPAADLAPVKTSQAPRPAAVSSAQGRSTTPNLATASMDEYRAARKAQGARWAR